MNNVLLAMVTLMPALMMFAAMLLSRWPLRSAARLWRTFILLSAVALAFSLIAAFAGQQLPEVRPWLHASRLGLALAVLVQLLCTVIAAFSSRYLDGEAGQQRYVSALAGVMAAVHLLLMADHWVVLVTAWALVGGALQHLLCFYQDRPFALLAAHKKQIADRLADMLLLGAAILAWREVGSGSLSDLWAHVAREGTSTSLQFSAVGLALAVILRTALLPVHGWLTQVMEAPTPVSALLHAGVVNLGGYVLILFTPLLEQATVARTLLVVFGVVTAVLAGMVMLTRISIKVRLAWSTVAQMGFMLLECGLGLYNLAALHLIGHSLYKAHAFLSASAVVRQTRLQAMRGKDSPLGLSLLFAPAVAVATVLLAQWMVGGGVWPWWWSVILGLAWAPLLWLPVRRTSVVASGIQAAWGVLMVAGLTGTALLAHALPLGVQNAPDSTLGLIAVTGMMALYVFLATLQLRPHALLTWRRWSYAGFYLDEAYTRLALHLWPARWTREPFNNDRQQVFTLIAAKDPK
ncbi:NADH-quinone oxidoreductase subunit L [Duganella sp. FT135W]|uniref:Probable inorganic carbon transporter subunit DabB n=1 Tax=Duganella flavida TaxID=2692175 RepID=A0A6L8K4N1_9BURK|nr:NADH-quinone oxidoreductase subunit L [Duganella flavida]MYM22190.1 NADH-quinone oxidoreductase subunit L [Duganella flavida]